MESKIKHVEIWSTISLFKFIQIYSSLLDKLLLSCQINNIKIQYYKHFLYMYVKVMC